MLKQGPDFHFEISSYSNILKISPLKTSFQIKILIFFIFLLNNIDFGYSLVQPRHVFVMDSSRKNQYLGILGIVLVSLRKHTYSSVLRILPLKLKTFRLNIRVVFIFLLKT